MVQIKSASDQLHDALRLAMLDAPAFLRKPLSPIVMGIDAWVNSVESRLAAIERMPSPAELSTLALGPVAGSAAHIEQQRVADMEARIERTNCEVCDE